MRNLEPVKEILFDIPLTILESLYRTLVHQSIGGVELNFLLLFNHFSRHLYVVHAYTEPTLSFKKTFFLLSYYLDKAAVSFRSCRSTWSINTLYRISLLSLFCFVYGGYHSSTGVEDASFASTVPLKLVSYGAFCNNLWGASMQTIVHL